MAVEAALAQWLGFQAGRATWPLTTCTRAENALELLLDSRTGMRGELGLQRTVAYISPHRPQTTPHRLRCYSRASGPRSGTRRGLTRALTIGPVTSQAAPTCPPQAPEHRMRRNTCTHRALRAVETRLPRRRFVHPCSGASGSPPPDRSRA